MHEQQRRPLFDRIRLLALIWGCYLRVVLMSRRPLPDQVRALQARPVSVSRPVAPGRLGGAIHRGLRVGPIAPRCLPKALVMFAILSAQGLTPELVIGLPREARSHEAHAWIELDSIDVGPPPGRAGHEELVRYV